MVAAKGDDARVFVSNQIILGARRKRGARSKGQIKIVQVELG